MSTNCYIYRCAAKQDMYIYLAEENDFDCIDEKLKRSLGELTFAMTLELNKNTRLVKENPVKVMENLQSQKFHLQLPAETSIEKLMSKLTR
ncbi:MAG: YcgL domain-containing protein [Gammaproteobacteria bacterium]|nr:YcgL domain-containing protein [Gammaproteobacteria bacterium]